MRRVDVAVVGGGVVGCAVARRLARYRLEVALLEAGDDLAVGSTKANSAIVHGGYAEPGTGLRGRLCHAGRRQFADLEAELHFGFKACGSLVLGFAEEDLPRLEALRRQGEANGLRDLSILNREQVLAREPGVNPSVRWALLCEGAGICSPWGLALALAENAVANGARLWLHWPVAAIAATPEGFCLTCADGRQLLAGYVVNAAGYGAQAVAAMVGDDSFSLHPRSGEYIILNRGSGAAARQVLFGLPGPMGKGILVAPTVFGNLLLGPDAIDERRYDRDTHADRLYSIYTQARHSLPGVDIRRFLRSFAGVRAVSDSDDFVIRPAAGAPRMVHAAGIQSPGLTASPAITEMVEGLLAEAGLALAEKPEYDPARRPYDGAKRDWLAPEALAPLLVLPQGAAGRMLCRCEQVPEALVRQSLTRGLPVQTVDGIKRRTRAGMGFCQGEFCRPRTAALLGEVNGRPADTLTDAQRDGLTRVGREEMLAWCRAREAGQ